MIHILEDESDFSQPLAEILESMGFSVQVSESIAAFKALDLKGIDLLVLDRSLPDGDGLNLLNEIRRESDLPVIILTGLSAISERVRGMNADADHYLVKPVDIDELLAIIQRYERKQSYAAAVSQEEVWQLDAKTWVLTAPTGIPVMLTYREAQLIGKFSGIPGKSVHREELVAAMGFLPDAYDFRRLETMVSRLRKKLGEHGVDFPLTTIYGGSYALQAQLEMTGVFNDLS